MNVKKTKMMVLNGEVKEPIMLRGEKIDVENSFPYLGVTIKPQQSSAGEEVAARIAKAIRLFKSLYHPLWKRKQVSVKTKMAIYRSAVLPVLLYGSETWVLSVKESERLEVFQMKCLRQILGITKFHHQRNEDIRARTEQCKVGELVTRSRLRWLGHVTRMKEGRLPPRLLFGRIEGVSRKGRPVLRWRDMIQSDLKKRKVKSWYNVVQDRAAWRRVVNGEKSASKIRGVRKKEGEEKDDGVSSGRLGLTCPKCGKEYQSDSRGWFSKHVEECGTDGGGGGGVRCPTCQKHYKSKAGGWFQKHITICGSSRSSSLG